MTRRNGKAGMSAPPILPWAEPACLVRAHSDSGDRSYNRRIVAEGSLFDVAAALSRIPTQDWKAHTICFTERRQAPLSCDHRTFLRDIISPWLQTGWARLHSTDREGLVGKLVRWR